MEDPDANHSSPPVFVKFDKIRSFLWFLGDKRVQGLPFSWLSGAGRRGSFLWRRGFWYLGRKRTRELEARVAWFLKGERG
jgi:hypothetical protein